MKNQDGSKKILDQCFCVDNAFHSMQAIWSPAAYYENVVIFVALK